LSELIDGTLSEQTDGGYIAIKGFYKQVTQFIMQWLQIKDDVIMVHENDQDIETYMRVVVENDQGLKQVQRLQLHEQMKSGVKKPTFTGEKKKDTVLPYLIQTLKNIRKQKEESSSYRYLVLYSSDTLPAGATKQGVVNAKVWSGLQTGVSDDVRDKTTLTFVQLRNQLQKEKLGLTVEEFDYLLHSFYFNNCKDESYSEATRKIEDLIRSHDKLGMKLAAQQVIRNVIAGLFLHVFHITITRKSQQRRFTRTSLCEVVSRYSVCGDDIYQPFVADLSFERTSCTEKEAEQLLSEYLNLALHKCERVLSSHHKLVVGSKDLLKSILNHFRGGNYTLTMIAVVDSFWYQLYGDGNYMM